MKHVWFIMLGASLLATSLTAQTGSRQQGTIIRMRMAECMVQGRGFMAMMAGSQRQQISDEVCPEYVLLSDRVVYVIVGKTSGSLVPLAETTHFRLQKNELLIRVDDTDHEVRFAIREMILRNEWDIVHAAKEAASNAAHRQQLELPVADNNP